ncbi:MAG: phosphoribosylaminoimidazolesuccinocarboxamide synthase [Bdellovibrionales bacterium]|nr:phosphoribosylaminoimidazolesuccinocarboxamide synthase [Bdellovibrionales bacterium]
MQKSDLIYEGKCKKIFKVEGASDKVWMEFKDNLTAYNNKKKSSFTGKGRLNRDTSSLLFQYLSVSNHWVKDQGETGMITQSLSMIPLEVVVRNRLAGSTAKKFQKKDGTPLSSPLFELYYKDESLGDPFISSEQAVVLGWSSIEEIDQIKTMALLVNEEFSALCSKVNLELIDFKLEFGKTSKGELLLGDEISADSCRIWTTKGKRLDKDRFRLDLGNVKEGYQEIYEKLKSAI